MLKKLKQRRELKRLLRELTDETLLERWANAAQ